MYSYSNFHLTSLQYTKALQLVYYIFVVKLAYFHLRVWLDAPAFAQQRSRVAAASSSTLTISINSSACNVHSYNVYTPGHHAAVASQALYNYRHMF
jgi:hypothetical protein